MRKKRGLQNLDVAVVAVRFVERNYNWMLQLFVITVLMVVGADQWSWVVRGQASRYYPLADTELGGVRGVYQYPETRAFLYQDETPDRTRLEVVVYEVGPYINARIQSVYAFGLRLPMQPFVRPATLQEARLWHRLALGWPTAVEALAKAHAEMKKGGVSCSSMKAVHCWSRTTWRMPP